MAGLCLRRFDSDDTAQLVSLANDRSIWLQVRDSFPHPYTEADAQRFINHVAQGQGVPVYAMQWQAELAGAIGLTVGEDINRLQAEVGYWVGKRFRSRCLGSAALGAVAEQALLPGRYQRLIALPFARNQTSARVLERSGFRLEARLERSAVKDGVLIDQLLYARLA